jgi:16S rRNA (guanine527-N7)-methyltransferase
MDILLKYFPELDSVQLEQYQGLVDLTSDWNRKINLISRKDIEHVVERHILHSLGIALHAPFRSGIRILDVGTGGGFPGLPLAIMFPDARFTLIDSIGKKVNVVESICAELGLKNASCLKIRAEDYTRQTDLVISRAVTRLERFTGWVIKNLPGESTEGSGIWYLKGGDLGVELKPYPEARVYELSESFSEPFFESKKLVWLSSHTLK